jgi:predicted  nucleic acid-binding Zn-ribbon protein
MPSNQAEISRLNRKIEDLDDERVKLKQEFDAAKRQIEIGEGLYQGLTQEKKLETFNKKEEAFNKKEEAIYAAIHDLRQKESKPTSQ